MMYDSSIQLSSTGTYTQQYAHKYAKKDIYIAALFKIAPNGNQQ